MTMKALIYTFILVADRNEHQNLIFSIVVFFGFFYLKFNLHQYLMFFLVTDTQYVWPQPRYLSPVHFGRQLILPLPTTV